ncbi:MAG: hypothetical protein LBC29_05785 [Propionibacteriaceae bacterium]|jgi:hypothetical protein|nr:hypothetical protein [Propionibacteriaceae bacterium]
MREYTGQELELAKSSIASTLQKCEKMQAGGKLQSAQKTLNDRRVDALRIALALIEKEQRARGYLDSEISVIDAYIAAQPESVRGLLQDIRKTIRAAAPDASEKISYQMPTF